MTDPSTLTSPSELILALEHARLVVISGTNQGEDLKLERESVTIGTLDSCDLILEDDFASHRHFQVIRKQNAHYLIDLQSKNGTKVNGLKVTEIKLVPGAIVRAGKTELFYSIANDFNDLPLSKADHLGPIVGKSVLMRRLFALIEKIAPADITVLIEGETGTGKELTAQTIHALSKRAEGPFIVVDCGGVAGNLIEGELFGFEKGAFTGADRTHIGAFERAHGGTIFLDEIGELRTDLQPKLLRVLEQRIVQRVGGVKPINIDVRILAATNRDLERACKEKHFRLDLYFRLAVMKVLVPSLRDRPEDIPLLVEEMLKDEKQVTGIHAEAMKLLAHYDWPGNIRQLRNVLERAAAVAESREIQTHDLEIPETTKSSKSNNRLLADEPELRSLDEAERQLIIATLKACGGNKTATSQALGIAPSTLYAKLKRLKIPI